MTQKRNFSSPISSVGVQPGTQTSSNLGTTSSSQKAAQPKSVELAMVDLTEEKKAKKRTIPLPSWHFLGVFLILLSGGVGFLATSVLLSFNGSSNCHALYVPLASATTRLYCAQLEAEQRSLENYLKAISMVDGFPLDHALRPDIDRNIESWTLAILDLADTEFQQGKLDEAIAIAEQIPTKSTARILADEQIEDWRILWREGEKIFAKVEREISDGNLSGALRTAVQLSYLETPYWSTVKYEEARNQIQLARKENKELDVAFVSFRRGGIDNWLNAIEQASKISKDSYAYPQAQKLIDDARQDVIRHIEGVVERRQWNTLRSLSDRLPSRLNLDDMVVNLRILAQAGISAENGSVAELEAALVQVQTIQPSSFLYDQSQILTRRWQQEIGDIAIIEEGDALAAGGSIAALERAIAKLNLIGEGNARYSEARRKIAGWRDRIEVIEDTPTLEYAKDLAASNRTDALNDAILQARSITPGRALYSEAQENIRKWQGIVERREDQPIYDRAISLGAQKRYSEAIAVANGITAGRAMYPQMQDKVSGWRQQITASTKLQNAYQAASGGSVQGLVNAIRLTQEIPSSVSDARSEGRSAADRWSYGILNEAQRQANTSSIPQAIATARLVPSGTAAYAPAQVQIEAWERLMRPADPIELETTLPDSEI